ncbi:lipid A biosynthesis acyltransferase [Taibaiella sp. KBW10]|uniref:LpxL/LpxP family acyltransferase n=1 Tax=Taibaiella sp. KBW10 TaxID=2153357 RepID=UPI000F596908|nr:lipid A biosynthesis acyltransferase [Taibaiella sp. KBW10]RQO32474.1 lipid A biosynthesis acyltransferase [Taibaiella sp. KBW10]
MSSWNGKSKGTALGYKIFIALLRIGGLRPAYALLYLVAWYYVFFVPAATRPILYLYRERLGFDKRKRKKLLRKNILLFGQTILDKIYTLSTRKNPFTVTREGGHHLNEMVAAGKGGIIVSAHLGNYELAGHLLERLETIVNIVMYDGEDTQIKAYLDNVTGERTFHIIYIKEDMSHIYEMSAALSRNELICLHADRYVPGNRTIEHSFLGKTAQFPLGPFILASKLRAPVSIVFAMKRSDFHYHFTATPPEVFEGRGTTGAEKMLGKYIQEVEQKVREYPEQWFNYFDFWEDIKA